MSQLRKVIEPESRSGDAVIVTDQPGYVARRARDSSTSPIRGARPSRREALGAGGHGRRPTPSPRRSPPGGAAACERPGRGLRRGAIRRLEELRDRLEDHIEAQLALGRHREAVPSSRPVAEHPLRERLRGQLMLALYRSGVKRRRSRRSPRAALLVDELGIEPGEPLRALHQRILEQDPALDCPPWQHGARGSPCEGRAGGASAALAAVVLAAAVAVSFSPSTVNRRRRRGRPPIRSCSTRRAARAGDVDVGGTPTSVRRGGAAWVLNADDQTITRVDQRTRAVRTFGSGGLTARPRGGRRGTLGGQRHAHPRSVHRPGRHEHRPSRPERPRSAGRAAGDSRRAVHEQPPAGSHRRHYPSGAVNPDATISSSIPAPNEVSCRPAAQAPAPWRQATRGCGRRLRLVAGADRSRGAAVDKRIRVAANTLSAIAVGAGAVWAAAPTDGTAWRVDRAAAHPAHDRRRRGRDGPGLRAGSVWALNSLRGTVSRIDPKTNRVTATAGAGQHAAPDRGWARGVWVTVAGAAGAPAAAAMRRRRPGAPGGTCGRVFYGGRGVPDRLIVSDMPLRGGGAPDAADERSDRLRPAPARLPRRALAHRLPVVRRLHGAGRASDDAKCAANAKLYAQTTA